ncbi:putative membrane protein YkoI [Arcanobacterium wilhelmae]|uniref:Membrane protein YkoI n=1 Tax=Arcanobacterium wilhelmae TaxID=1803177 RepID=A0ABT9NC33_9ACTO|nr:PepSY domain-containing protein [Arcanobacterium wilhelmae]MDP9801281.1 putative membrane protein YkoI [Arcanobacterium wilhelmae]WFN90627.1 PepSY domain-containing protein [Arcanobacterium wilhelmae]
MKNMKIFGGIALSALFALSACGQGAQPGANAPIKATADASAKAEESAPAKSTTAPEAAKMKGLDAGAAAAALDAGAKEGTVVSLESDAGGVKMDVVKDSTTTELRFDGGATRAGESEPAEKADTTAVGSKVGIGDAITTALDEAKKREGKDFTVDSADFELARNAWEVELRSDGEFTAVIDAVTGAVKEFRADR